MTKEFIEWFEKYAPAYLYPNPEERENLQLMCWLAWRDGIRSLTKGDKCLDSTGKSKWVVCTTAHEAYSFNTKEEAEIFMLNTDGAFSITEKAD